MKTLIISSLLFLSFTCLAEQFCNEKNECINLSTEASKILQSHQDKQLTEEKLDHLIKNNELLFMSGGEGSGGF